jgi:hypothetical protein
MSTLVALTTTDIDPFGLAFDLTVPNYSAPNAKFSNGRFEGNEEKTKYVPPPGDYGVLC